MKKYNHSLFMKKWHKLHLAKKIIRKCKDCKKILPHPYNKSIRCNSCARKKAYKNNPQLRLVSINNLPKSTRGKNNGMFKHGLSHTKKYKQKIQLKANLKKYNLTPNQFKKLLKKQNNVCAICGKIESNKNQYGIRRLSIDHNHINGKVRGLLCQKCNSVLGLINDDILILKIMIKYLIRNNK
jgi:hypothetical protein